MMARCEAKENKVPGHYQFGRSGSADLTFSSGFDSEAIQLIISAKTFMGHCYHFLEREFAQSKLVSRGSRNDCFVVLDAH